jgi:hypothetical protein
MMRDHATTNRILMALLGIVLLGGGLLVLAGGADIYRRWNLSPPDSWPLTTPQNALIPRADQTRWTDQGWWWPTVIAALALLLLLALTWLLAQSRRRRAHPLSVGESPQQAVTVSDNVLGDALTDDLDTLTGVRRAQARLGGSRTHPEAQIDLTLEPGSTPEHALKEIYAVTERARRSAGWDELPTHVVLNVARHGPHRAE